LLFGEPLPVCFGDPLPDPLVPVPVPVPVGFELLAGGVVAGAVCVTVGVRVTGGVVTGGVVTAGVVVTGVTVAGGVVLTGATVFTGATVLTCLCVTATAVWWTWVTVLSVATDRVMTRGLTTCARLGTDAAGASATTPTLEPAAVEPGASWGVGDEAAVGLVAVPTT
jgi:hypothetical protein